MHNPESDDEQGVVGILRASEFGGLPGERIGFTSQNLQLIMVQLP
jgi:hypothetical protein